jgi:bifunctional non-homologous end joining protein LigD
MASGKTAFSSPVREVPEMSEALSARLYFREGSSDKVYNVQLDGSADLWTVEFQYGRRGIALTAGTKIFDVPYEKARAVFDKLVREKVAKGYTEMEDGVRFTSSALVGRSTGFRPQLLNEISDDDAQSLGADWLIQEKHDGERRGVEVENRTVTFSNRRGLEVAVEQPIADAVLKLGRAVGGRLVLDTEDMGSRLVIFDVIDHFMLREGTFRERAAILAHLQKTILDQGLRYLLEVDIPTPAPVFFKDHLPHLRQGGAEGYVLRHAESRYTPGRPASGGEALKVKFWAEATCRVTAGRDGKSSVGLELRDADGTWKPVGNVTVPSNRMTPQPGTLVEVRYLYAYPGGALFQPTMKGQRHDLTEDAARIDQLKFKVEPEEASPEPSF